MGFLCPFFEAVALASGGVEAKRGKKKKNPLKNQRKCINDFNFTYINSCMDIF